MIKAALTFIFLLQLTFLPAQSIAEKKASFSEKESDLPNSANNILKPINNELSSYRKRLQRIQDEVLENFNNKRPPESYSDQIEEMQNLQIKINQINKKWHETLSSETTEDPYALWNQPNASIAQLILDYGAQKYIYLIPPEIFDIPVNIISSLPIPSESWDEALTLILKQSGIGICKLNPYIRKLFLLNADDQIGNIEAITNRRSDLNMLPQEAEVCFIFSPSAIDINSTKEFLEKFSSASKISIDIINNKFFIFGKSGEIKELFKIYDFIDQSDFNKNYKFIRLQNSDPKDIINILDSIFKNEAQKQPSTNSIKFAALNRSSRKGIFIWGAQEDINQAEEIIGDIEGEIEGATGKVIHVYTCKNSNTEEIAEILSKAYSLIKDNGDFIASPSLKYSNIDIDLSDTHITRLEEEPEKSLVINPDPIAPDKNNSIKNSNNRNNFIIDPKTSSIIMVVEKELLPMLKNLLVRLDVPKKMVHIEVLLFEKKISNQNNFGLNILRLCQKASNIDSHWASWSGENNLGPNLNSSDKLSNRQGILDFFISHKKRGRAPAFDLAYSFLMSQDDVTVHSSPSISTINQTAASIKLVEEVSIKTGAVISGDDNSKDTYARNQYGITIEITPTIHELEDQDENNINCITLDTDITFDDTPTTVAGQPNITRRNIKNQVRVEDGQSVILGGLRRKNSSDKKNSIPFLGEIPGVGKLFSETSLSGSSKEMFIFITPKIVTDDRDKLKIMQQELLKWRPGDSPEFIDAIIKAKASEKQRMFEGSLKMLFGEQTMWDN